MISRGTVIGKEVLDSEFYCAGIVISVLMYALAVPPDILKIKESRPKVGSDCEFTRAEDMDISDRASSRELRGVQRVAVGPGRIDWKSQVSVVSHAGARLAHGPHRQEPSRRGRATLSGAVQEVLPRWPPFSWASLLESRCNNAVCTIYPVLVSSFPCTFAVLEVSPAKAVLAWRLRKNTCLEQPP